MKLKQTLFDQIYDELNLIDKQINESTINTNFSLLIERLEYLEEQINDNNELKSNHPTKNSILSICFFYFFRTSNRY